MKVNKDVNLVPARYRNLVLAELEALGLDADGNQMKVLSTGKSHQKERRTDVLFDGKKEDKNFIL